jgi:hypothetical protein
VLGGVDRAGEWLEDARPANRIAETIRATVTRRSTAALIHDGRRVASHARAPVAPAAAVAAPIMHCTHIAAPELVPLVAAGSAGRDLFLRTAAGG